MKKDEKDFMNYDENGFYPDEKPDSSNTEYTITEKILGIAALVMFIGTIIYIIIMAGQEGKGWMQPMRSLHCSLASA